VKNALKFKIFTNLLLGIPFILLYILGILLKVVTLLLATLAPDAYIRMKKKF